MIYRHRERYRTRTVRFIDPFPGNAAPVGVPTISGTATQGQTLTASAAGVTDADGLGTFSYQWQRNGVGISGATNTTYVLTNDDVGALIAVRVSYTDGMGKPESVVSDPTSAVVGINDPPSGAPVITGTPTQGEVLIANTASISDPDGLGPFSYQWKRGGANISGATSSVYLLVIADVGATITVTVSWTDGQGFSESLTSAGVGPIAGLPGAGWTVLDASGTSYTVAYTAVLDGAGTSYSCPQAVLDGAGTSYTPV
jgi:hypothetical protein